MSDLISREVVLESIKKMDLSYMQQKDIIECIKDSIDRLPTAYDVDKVVERLVKWHEKSMDGLICVGVAIDLVKAGGTE